MLKRFLGKYNSLPVQVKASFWFLICSFMQKGISALATPIFTRLLTPAEYGNFNVFSSWLSIVTIFVSLQLYYGVYTSGLVKFKEERAVFASSLQGLTLLLTLCWTVVYVISRNFWNNFLGLTTVQVLSMLTMIWTTAVFNFWAAEQRVEYKYRNLVIITILVSILKPVVGVFFVINAEDKVTARILAILLTELICYTGLFWVQLNKGKVFFSKKYWKYSLSFNLPLIPHYLSQTVLSSADRIMIRDMIGSSEAGIYGLAYSVALIMTIFNASLSQSVSPWMYQKIKDKNIAPIGNIAYLTLVLIAVVNLFLICLAPEVISFFAPLSYHEAIWIIPPVAMSVYFMFMYDYFARFEIYYEKTTFMMLASIIGAGLNIALNAVFIRLFGYMAAGYTTLVCYILYVVGHYYMMRQICKTYLDDARAFELKFILLISAVFMCLGFILMGTYKQMFLRYGFMLIGICGCLYNWKSIKDKTSQILRLKYERKNN